MKRSKAIALRRAILAGSVSLSDAIASTAPELFPRLKEDGSLVEAGTRICHGGKVLVAAADLWDTAENSPDKAPTLYEELEYIDGIRKIPDVITVAKKFSKGEKGIDADGVIWVSLYNDNVYTPTQFKSNWEVYEP